MAGPGCVVLMNVDICNERSDRLTQPRGRTGISIFFFGLQPRRLGGAKKKASGRAQRVYDGVDSDKDGITCVEDEEEEEPVRHAEEA